MRKIKQKLSNKLTKNFKYKQSFSFSLVIHVFVIFLLVFSFNWQAPKPIVNKGHKIVHAVAVDDQQVQKLVKDLKKQQADKIAAEKARQKHLDKLAQQSKNKRIAEQKRLNTLKKQQAQEAKKLAQQKAKEKAVLQKLKKDQAAQSKQLKDLEAQQKQAQDKLAKLKKQNADQTKQQQQYKEALELQKKIAAKQAAIAKQKSQAIEGIVNKYKGLILEAISQNWLVPPGTNPKLSCQLFIELGNNGKVTNVRVMKSSGNSLLDRSAVAAVYKASPLPAPSDQEAYKAFKSFSLAVKPENIINVG